MAKKSAVTTNCGLHALVWKEGNWFVVKCVEVEVASQGKSKKEALGNIEEALALYFKDEKLETPKPLSDLEMYPVCYA